MKCKSIFQFQIITLTVLLPFEYHNAILLPHTVPSESSMPALFSLSKRKNIVKSTQLTNKRSQGNIYNNDNNNKMSIANCTCYYQRQPLDHFAVGSLKKSNSTFEQRYCVYDGYAKKHVKNTNNSHVDNSPIFFYTGELY